MGFFQPPFTATPGFHSTTSGPQISKQEVVVRHIDKDVTVLYEFQKAVDIKDLE
jgi:hypothetical protein